MINYFCKGSQDVAFKKNDIFHETEILKFWKTWKWGWNSLDTRCRNWLTMISRHKVYVKIFWRKWHTFWRKRRKKKKTYDVTVNCDFLVITNWTVKKVQIRHAESDLSDLHGSTAFLSALCGYQDCKERRSLCADCSHTHLIKCHSTHTSAQKHVWSESLKYIIDFLLWMCNLYSHKLEPVF